MEFSRLIIRENEHTIKSVLEYINKLAIPRVVLFVVDSEGRLCGALNEGDIRRAMLAGKGFDTNIKGCLNEKCKFLTLLSDNYLVFKTSKQSGIRFLPMVNAEKKIVNIIDTNSYFGLLPFEVVLMAGGKGERLMPLTEKTPKPLLKVGDKAIIDYNIERLIKFGVTNFHITLGYLGKQIEEHIAKKFGNQINVTYHYEEKARGTAGSLSEIKVNTAKPLLFMNCDLLTNIDYSSMYEKFISGTCDLLVASIEYHVDLPYAVFEFNDKEAIRNLSEKPRYTYETNAGIYLLSTALLKHIPKEGKYDATDFLEELIKQGKEIRSFPLVNYWLDIGRHEDYTKAQHDINYINFE